MSHDHDEKPGSLWKKEISFKRKQREEPVEPLVDVSEEDESFELSLEAIALIAGPEREPEVVPEPIAAVDHGWLTQPLEEVSEPPLELVELPDPVAVALPVEPLVELPPVHALPVPEPLSFEPAAFEPLSFEPPSFEPPSFEPGAFEPAVSQAEVVQPQPEPVLAPEPETVQVEAPAAVPFYKRELSFGRSKAPKSAKAPTHVVQPQLEPTSTADAVETAPAVPFYKRDLSFSRSKTPKAEKASKAEKALKAEKAPKGPKAEKPAKEKPERASRTPRELPKLRRVSRPKASAPGAKAPKKLVGLKIGSSQIAAARIENGDVPELLQAVRDPLEPGIVVGGELRDPEALAVALREFFKRHGLPKRGVRLGIANNRIGVRTFDVAGIDDPKQLDNAIKFRAQEVLPIPIEEAVLDYQILSEFTNEEGQLTRRVLLVVAYRDLVDRYLLACGMAGIQIVGIDLEAFALLRAIAAPRPPLAAGHADERGALVAVAIGHERSTFAVSDGRVCEFTRVLEWGGWAMNVAIARALDTSPSEAEPIKRALSFAGAGELPNGINAEQLDTAREAARRQLQSFARELVSSLQFYQNQPGSLGIGEIVVTGGTTHLPGFGAELERLVGVPVRVGDPLTRVKVSKKVRERDQLGSLAVAIGLGIED